MSQAVLERSRLLAGCAGAALALGLVLGASPAAAQGVQATSDVVTGTAFVSAGGPNQTNVEVVTPTVVIDWTPTEDAGGNALDFLPAGSLLNFNSGQLPDFAVLNRILPATNGNIARIDGSVISRVTSAAGPVPGGFVAFYSPTGLLIGGTASFDVGRLLLTTLDISSASFETFAQQGGFMTLTGAAGSTARVQINPGAQILATPENAFFAVVAADIEMRGTARVNGSHAFVAGEVVNLRFSNGLFDIAVPVGTAAAGEVVTLDGTVGGPSSTGVTGDNHMIYAVARASQDPISMLFRGNLGFDPAQSVGVVNGEIILAANYNVFGRTVDGGSIAGGVNAVFGANSELTNVRADIVLEDFAASSSLLAIGTHRTQAAAVNAASAVAGNLLLVGREAASLTASNNRNLTVTGDVLVSAQDYGVSNSGLQSLDVINAQGGTARLEALGGGSINITGQARVLADAFAGVETIDRIAGTAQGGQASLGASGSGTVAIGSDVLVRANGFGTGFQGILVGAAARGGSADLFARSGGAVTLDSSVIVAAQGFGANGSLFSPSTRSDAYGGQARITVSDGGGSIFVQGFAEANAGATALDANVTGDGALADAGEAVASITGPGSINVRGDLRLIANALAGNNAGGTGGTGLGGRATAITFSGGTIDVGLLFRADALGIGGNGINGGAGFGGIAGANAIIGSIAIEGNAEAQSDGFGGGAAFGFGGAGGLGQGGNAFFQANGTLTQTAQVTIGGTGIVVARGRGGFGGAGSISTGPQGGRGGDGIGGQFNVPNQADPAFNSGAFLLAGGDNGRLVITGTATADASGTGGTGGSGGIPGGGGRGGDGTGGLAQVGMALLGQNGSVGQGRATFANVFAAAVGTGGDGGFSSGPAGTAGDGFGGSSVFTVDAGDAIAGLVDLIATGLGGAGSSGGLGRGGLAAVFGGLGGTLTADSLSVIAEGAGGLAFLGTGGAGLGGEAAIIGDGITLNVNESVLIEASGRGGSSDDGAAGTGTGGRAYVAANAPGSVAITGHAEIFANGFGGNSITAFAAGTGSGGLAYVDALGGGTITLGSMQGLAIGRGGEAQSHEGGDGIGGTVRLRASGAGSRLNILRNMPAGFVAESPAGEAFISVDGFGELTRDGDGIGGEGRGGTVEILADTGGTIGLPVNIINDPDRAADSLLVFASGTGGGSLVEGGVGGNASGGLVSISVDGAGSGVVMGDANLLALATAGSGLDLGLNTAGGTAVGGRRIITAVNGAALTFGLLGGQTGARGGDGTGTGDGGIARSGTNRVTLDNATLAVTGVLSLFDDTVGGNGQRGGDAIGPGEGGAAEFSANASTINLTPDAGGLTGINVESAATGGAGVAGGDAFSGAVRFTLLDTDLTQGIVRVTSRAIGGSTTSANGAGGNAFSRPVLVNIDRATLDLSEFQATAAAIGGAGGVEIGGLGGNGLAGTANVTLTDSALTIAPGGPSTGGGMAIRADGIGGAGFAAGNGTGAQAALTVTRSAIDTDLLLVTARGDAIGVSGQPGGNGTGGLAQIALNGASTIAASGISLISSATTSAGGSATAGRAVLRVGADPAASITADDLVMLADAFGANAGIGANVAGQFNIDLNGGNLNLGFLFASSLGDATSGNLAPSRLVANGGNINVTDALSAVAFGDLLVSSSLGGIIGSSAVAGTTTAIQLDASGTVDIAGDGSTGGLGGQSIAITAGRSILIDGNLSATDGGITLLANTGGGQPASQPPLSTIAMTQGAAINGGTGTVTVHLLDGGSDPQRQTGEIVLSSISAQTIDVRHFGTAAGNDIRVLAGSVLTASGAGRAIDLASLNGEVINLAGDAGLVLTGGGHYAIFAATPTGSQIGSFANYARRYNVADAAAYDLLNPGGNFAAFRIAPVLTVTANDASRFYGSANPAFTASFAGFLPGDGVADLAGAVQFTTLAGPTSGIGTFVINAAQGSLLSAQGYQFSFAPGILTITPRPITVTANNLTRIYGNANPSLTFTVGGQGLVNGDQLTGALATTAGVTTGVGNVAITQGTLAANANYVLTFAPGILSITPRPITVTANDAARIYGDANPSLTFTVGGQGLVNGDQLSGALATAAGATTGVGNVAITQGTLTVSANYALTFNPGILSITPRPITITANNATRIYGNANPSLTFTVGGLGLVNGDQLTGALGTTAGATTGIGTAAITLGTLTGGANYAIAFTGGQLSITPRPITLTADDLAKLLGLPDPPLTVTVTGDGLVNGDQLTGALVRDPGEAIGTFAIRRGTLGASDNYAVTFVGGTFTINPPPAPAEINNPTLFEEPLAPADTPVTVEGEDDDRFGIDFPDQPEAPLISEDPLLDDPVTSGGDASVYGSGAVPPAGGQ
jgi:lipopolysaccharide export system protein LptA